MDGLHSFFVVIRFICKSMIPLTLPIFLFLGCSKEAQPTALMELRGDMQVKGTVSGTIVGSSGTSLSAVHISLDDNSYTTISLPNGDFSIPDIPAGNYSVSLKRFSFSDTTIDDIELSVNQDLVLFDQIVMRSTRAKLSGRVTTASAGGVAGAGITIANQPYMTLSDESGDFGFTDLHSGPATIIAARKGIGWGETVVELLPDNKLSVSIFLDNEGGRIQGSVLDEHGNGIGGEIVSAMGGGITDTTNEDGEYILDNLPSTIPITISAGEERSLGGLRVREGGTLAGADLVQVNTVDGHGVVLGDQTVISAKRLPVKLTADLREDQDGRIPVDSIAHFRWDVDNDGEIDTVTSEPSLEIAPSSDWEEETNVGYGIMTVRGDTVDGAKITVRRVSTVPVVDANAPKSALRTGEPGVFKGKALSLTGNIIRYQWTFGDSSLWSRTDTANVVHRYSRPGVYKATFTAFTPDSSATDSVMIRVSGIHLGVALDTMALSEGIILDKPFHTDSLEYSATVPYDIESMFLTASALDSTSKVVFYGDTLEPQTPSDTKSLKVGLNEIVVCLIAVDGSVGEYVIQIKRQPNTDASLNEFAVTENGVERDIGFDKDTLSYRMGVSDTTDFLSVNAKATDSMALVIIDADDPDTLGVDEMVPVQLEGRETVTKLKVVAANRVDSRIYTFRVLRQPVLSSLTVSANGEPVDFEFESGRYVCSLEVEFSTEFITIVPQTSEETDLIIIEQDTLETGEYTRFLDMGTDTISISVVSVNNPLKYALKEYHFIVHRPTRSEASLSSLRIDDENGNFLAERFSPDSMSYELDLPYEVDSISISALPRDELASVVVEGDTVDVEEAFPLLPAVGSDTVEIVVTSADGLVENTYRVYITRLANPDASLQSLLLLVEGNNRDISFNASRFVYDIQLPWFCDSFVLAPTPSDSQASVSINDNTVSYGDSVNIAASGPDTVTIRVVASDQKNIHTYRLRVTNAPVPNPGISEILVTVQGMEPRTLTNDTNEFEIDVAYGTESIDLTPIAADSSRIIVEEDTIDSDESVTVEFSARKDTVFLTAFYVFPDTFRIYKIYINRMLRTEAALDSLTVFNEASGFAAQIAREGMRFSTTVPFGEDTVNIRLFPRDPEVAIKINDLPLESDTYTVPLLLMDNTFEIIVTAQDGQTDSVYTLVVSRSGDSNSLAQMISLNGSDIPGFEHNQYAYSLQLEPDVDSAELVVVPQSDNARVSINRATPVTGTYSQTISISENESIRVEIYSGDSTDTTLYTIEISRTHYRLHVSAQDYVQSLSLHGDTLIAAGDSVTISSINPRRYSLYRVHANGYVLEPQGGMVTLRDIRASDTVEAVLNHIPEFTGELDTTVYRGREFSYMPAVNDYDNDPLQFEVVDQSLPDGLQLNNETGEITGVPVSMGLWDVELTVTDNKSSPDTIGPLRIEIGIEDVFLVDSRAAGLETGLSWGNAFGDIDQALYAALQREAPCQIWIAAGVYNPGPEPQDCYELCQGVELFGGFGGSEQELAERNIKENQVYVTGFYNQEPANSIIIKAAENSLLDGLYIHGARQFENETSAAVYANDLVGIKIKSCEIYDNESQNMAAIYSDNSLMEIVSCVISNNGSAGESGTASAVYATGGDLNIQNTLFYNNVNGDYIIHNRGGSTTLINCTVADNQGYAYLEGYCKVLNTVIFNPLEHTQIRINSPETSYIENCLIEGAFDEGVINEGDGPVEKGYLTDADPMFENDGYYMFSDGSCLADGGNSQYNDPEIRSDVYGEPRIQGQSIDIGAVESPHSQHEVLFTVLPSDSGIAEPGEPVYLPRYTETPLSASPNEGYAFKRWEIVSGQPEIEDPFSDNTVVRVNGINDIIQPIFAEAFRLTVTVDGDGGRITCDPEYFLAVGDSILISAEAEPGFSFTTWEVDGALDFDDQTSPHTYVKLLDEIATRVEARFEPSRIVYVSEEGNDENNGVTWAGAKRTVQAGIDRAAEMQPSSETPVEVWVSQGTYYPTFQMDSDDPSTRAFLIHPFIHLYGGFRGTERDPYERQTVAGEYGDIAMVNETVLDGRTDSYRVVECIDEVVLDGVTITGGNNNMRFPEGGSAVYTGSATIKNCRIVNNSSTGTDFGSAIHGRQTANILIENCYIGNNSSQDVEKGGSALSLFEAQASITNSHFDRNHTDGSGGAVFAENAGYNIDGCAFTNNTSSHQGGAIFSIHSQNPYRVVNSVFEDNMSEYEGGAIILLDANLEFTNCTFYNNSSGNQGGGILINEFQEIASISNCILYNNTSAMEGFQSDFEDQIAIMGENENPPDVSYSCIQSQTGDLPYPGEGNIMEDPMFSEGELRLSIGSPCINSGNAEGSPIYDITGAQRDEFPDMGAYEYLE